MSKKGVLLSRPKDKNLEAYKAWISEMVHITGKKSDNSMSESEWEQAWKDFWNKDDGGS